jgi:hypothetical protein
MPSFGQIYVDDIFSADYNATRMQPNEFWVVSNDHGI